jgi:beta-glucosidase
MTAVRNTYRRGTFAGALLAASLLAGLPAAAQPATVPPATARPAATQPSRRPWMDPRLSPERRAELALQEMTRDEKLTLVVGYFASPQPNFTVDPQARMGSAGYVPGIERLGIPPQWQTDAGVGVATQGGAPEKRLRTPLPSGLATAATWNPDLAFAGGAMIGAEARSSGFDVMLAGGVNLPVSRATAAPSNTPAKTRCWRA